MIAAQHLPRRIADESVEPWCRQPPPPIVAKHFREFEGPVEETLPLCCRASAIEQGSRNARRQRDRAPQHFVQQGVEGAATLLSRRRNPVVKPSRAPEIGGPLPARE